MFSYLIKFLSTGLSIGLIEILLFGVFSYIIKLTHKNLRNIDGFTYYWTMMTILTGLWEISFISDYKSTNLYSTELLKNKTHVWTNNYDLTYVLPWKLSHIFYAEYGAYADREYMTIRNDWSRIIEGTHAIFCGLFSLLAIQYKLRDMTNTYKISLGIAMGSQLMNSILYMGNYFIECNSPDSLNLNTTTFPTGKYLNNRPFMYVNIFWTVMPLIIIIDLLMFNGDKLNTFSNINTTTLDNRNNSNMINMSNYHFVNTKNKINKLEETKFVENSNDLKVVRLKNMV
jgi:hypothetical protein